MEIRHLKLLFYSTEKSGYRSISLDRTKIISLAFMMTLFFGGLTGITACLGVKYHANTRVYQLQKQNGILISQLSLMEQKTKAINNRMKHLEQFDNELRIVADLPMLDDDVRSVGVGGFSAGYSNKMLEEMPSPLRNGARSIAMDLAELDRRIDLGISSLNEIEEKLHRDKRRVRHTPSITPVDGLVKSPYGNRVDPFEDVIRHHDGIDIAAIKGTAVQSPADGVIKFVHTGDIRKGYGQFVIIDHGNGVRTLFGHLSRVKVKKGQKIKRRDVIGEVGRTGRATGYHLHYEVIVNGRHKDPFYFIHDK